MMGRFNTPLGVLIVTTRTMQSFPGWVSLMTAVGHGKVIRVFFSQQEDIAWL